MVPSEPGSFQMPSRQSCRLLFPAGPIHCASLVPILPSGLAGSSLARPIVQKKYISNAVPVAMKQPDLWASRSGPFGLLPLGIVYSMILERMSRTASF